MEQKRDLYKWFWIIPGFGIFGFFFVGFVKYKIKNFSSKKYYFNVFYIATLLIPFIFLLELIGYLFGENVLLISNYILYVYALCIVNVVFYK